MNNKLNNKKTLWFSIIVVFATMAIYTFIGEVRPRLSNYIFDRFITQTILLILALIAAKLTSRLYTLKLSGDGFKEGIKAGLVEVIFVIYLLVSAIAYPIFNPEYAVTASAFEIIVFITSMLMLGVGEELLFRGILLNTFSDYYGETSSALIRKTAILAGVVFGTCHLVNIYGASSIIDPIVQSLCDICGGVLYCAIYIRSKKNIWPIVLIHAVNDISGFMKRGVLCGMANSATVSSFTISAVIFSVAELAVGLYLLRDKKLNELVKK